MKIAVLSPSAQAYSETFIRAHLNLLIGEKKLFYGSSIPDRVEGETNIGSSDSVLKRIKRKFFPSNFGFSETILYSNLKQFNPDVVLAEYGTTGASSLNVISLLKIPMVVHFHGFDAFKYDVIKNFQENYIKMFNYSSLIVVVSTPMKKQLIKLGCPEEKIVLNPYGPKDEFLKLTPNHVSKVILSVGRFTDKKAPYYTLLAFLKVVERIPESRLIMAGDGSLLETVKNLARHFEISDKVIFPGSMNHEQVLDLYQKSAIYTQHSIQALSGDCEGTPVSVIEASAAGLPVVSTEHAGIPEVVQDGISGYILKEHDVNGIAEKLIFLLENPEVAKRMGDAGKEFVRDNYTMKKHIDQLNFSLSQAVQP